jgi:hemoglobin
LKAVASQPSIPFRNSIERRATITRGIQEETGLNEVGLERLVRSVYDTARRDDVIGRLSNGVRDWEKHIAAITTFWSSVGLLSGRYHGPPLAAHVPLPLQPLDFARWPVLFEQTARAVCSPEGTDYLMEKAHRIAGSLEMGLAVGRGEFPSRVGAGT